MEVPVGFWLKLGSFLSFLPIFISLLILGLVKAAIIGPIAAGIISIGNSSIVLVSWPAHFLWTYYSFIRTKRLCLTLKILALVLLPVPLILWLIVGLLGSLTIAIIYSFFTPLVATFEAVGEKVQDKLHHCFLDGTVSAIKGSFTAVGDFADFCFYSFFSYLDELVSSKENPLDLKLWILPCCLAAIFIAVPIDFFLISSIALWKSPYMLFRGWKRLIEDLLGREGPFLETVCIPFAGLSILLWPLAVIGSVICAILSSFCFGLYSGFVVHQESSFLMGLRFSIAAVSLFDEYVNDLLYLREGSCFPRPRYRRSMSGETRNRKGASANSEPTMRKSRALKLTIRQYKPVRIWEWLFTSGEENGRLLLREGIITMEDIKEGMKSKKLVIKLPAWTILSWLLRSAKANANGLSISDEVELKMSNGPRDAILEWWIGPLMVMKEQLEKLEVSEEEGICLKTVVMTRGCERIEDWDGCGLSSEDHVRSAQLQAIVRRLEGIVASISKIPTFRRKFRNLVKVLALEAIQTVSHAV